MKICFVRFDAGGPGKTVLFENDDQRILEEPLDAAQDYVVLMSDALQVVQAPSLKDLPPAKSGVVSQMFQGAASVTRVSIGSDLLDSVHAVTGSARIIPYEAAVQEGVRRRFGQVDALSVEQIGDLIVAVMLCGGLAVRAALRRECLPSSSAYAPAVLDCIRQSLSAFRTIRGHDPEIFVTNIPDLATELRETSRAIRSESVSMSCACLDSALPHIVMESEKHAMHVSKVRAVQKSRLASGVCYALAAVLACIWVWTLHDTARLQMQLLPLEAEAVALAHGPGQPVVSDDARTLHMEAAVDIAGMYRFLQAVVQAIPPSKAFVEAYRVNAVDGQNTGMVWLRRREGSVTFPTLPGFPGSTVTEKQGLITWIWVWR